jgi:hypothetical protein
MTLADFVRAFEPTDRLILILFAALVIGGFALALIGAFGKNKPPG